jgi:hypothetical protein
LHFDELSCSVGRGHHHESLTTQFQVHNGTVLLANQRLICGLSPNWCMFPIMGNGRGPGGSRSFIAFRPCSPPAPPNNTFTNNNTVTMLTSPNRRRDSQDHNCILVRRSAPMSWSPEVALVDVMSMFSAVKLTISNAKKKKKGKMPLVHRNSVS